MPQIVYAADRLPQQSLRDGSVSAQMGAIPNVLVGAALRARGVLDSGGQAPLQGAGREDKILSATPTPCWPNSPGGPGDSNLQLSITVPSLTTKYMYK